MLSFENLQLRYEPFPIGVAKPAMGEDVYTALTESYPPLELFDYIPKVGHKYCLSEKYKPAVYREWIERHPAWRDFYHWLKTPSVAYDILDALKDHHLDLGIKRRSGTNRVWKRARNMFRGRGGRGEASLDARFEFSMLPADGGYVTPHTDSPEKIVTMVLSMAKPGEWDAEHGGGTDVNRHRRAELSFNRTNDKATFDDMEVIDTYPFQPNQCLLFIKTFNSWHSVRPMRGQGSEAMRRTLTINIETHY